MRYLLALLFYTQLLPVFGQETKTYNVNPGQKVYDAIPPAERYAYPDFESGLVNFRNGRLGGGRLNYNAILAEMEFISDKGDTLGLDDRETIRTIVIRSDTFFVDKRYLQKVAREGKLVLARSRVIMMSNHRRVGAMGQTTDASVDAFTALSSSGSPLKTMVAQEILTFKEHITYYLGDAFGYFRQINKKNLSAMFGSHKKDLEKYMDEHHPNFLKEEDMRKMLSFLASMD